MERIKVLFLYFGQPRMLEECLPWHDDLINHLQSNNISVDIQYYLWNQYTNRTHLYQTHDKMPYVSFDINKLEKNITKNRPCPVKCNWYSYNIVDEIYSQTSKHFNIQDFKHIFSQTISKGLACQNISQEYDTVLLLRPDLIFQPKRYSNIVEFLEDYNSQNMLNKNENIVFVSGMEYDLRKGFRMDDKILFGRPNSLNIWFNNFKEKIILYEKNVKKEFQEQHHIVCNFANFYPYDEYPKKSISIRTIKKIKLNIARPIAEVRDYLKTINEHSYNEIDDISHVLTQKVSK